MALQLFKEQFTGKYDGVTNPLLLPPGGIADGYNVRKISPAGGWKGRKGCAMNNTTAIAAAKALSLHHYKHPRNADYHFLAQCNSKLYDATNDPPANGTTFGTDIGTMSTTPAFSDTIEDLFLIADGSLLQMWGGDAPYCSGFLCYDSSEDVYVDYTRTVTDGRTDTEAIALGAASDVWYVCSPQIAEKITLNLGGTVNAATETLTLKSWQSAAWSDRSATDGTASGGATMAVDGAITWTRSASDEMRVIGGIMGYWYQLSFSGALTGSVDVISCTVTFDMMEVTNKWNGVFDDPWAVRFYDQSTGEYLELTGELTNESTSQYFNIDAATTSDFLYVKCKDRPVGIGIGVAAGYENDTGGGNVDNIDWWDGDSWTTISSGIVDETLNVAGTESFGQTGTIWFDSAEHAMKKRTMDFDSSPGYWIRLSWDAAPDNTADDVRIYRVVVAYFPESLPAYDGVIEFKGRAIVWGDPEFPNRLRFSSYGRPDCFAGNDSGYTDAFGDMSEIKLCLRFYNELLVFKERSVWLMEGYNKDTFGITRLADNVGIIAPKAGLVMELGSPGMHQDEPLPIAIWPDSDGVYALDGRKPRRVSQEVDHFFNLESSSVIGASELATMQAFPDTSNKEYHLLIRGTGTGHGQELVYNPVQDEWYPPWDRTVGGANDYLVCGLELRGTDNRKYTYAGNNAGLVFRLETDTADRDASNTDVKFYQYVTSRAFTPSLEKATTLEFTFRKVQLEAASMASATATVQYKKDGAMTATTAGTVDLTKANYNVTTPYVDVSLEGCASIQILVSVDANDKYLTLYSLLYLLEARGEIDV